MQWVEKDNALHATFEFKDFKKAFAFMTEVAFEAELQHHHPLWTNVYNRVSIQLSTHDAGNIVTEKDQRLAKAITKLWEDRKL